MPWNEPGRDKKKDPWGSPEPGPPNLDDLFGKMKRRFGGGKGNGAGGGSNGGDGFSAIGVIVLVLAALWFIYDSISVIDEGEVGVLLRFGEYETTLEPGLSFHFPRPIDRVHEVDIARIRSITDAPQMLTQDQNLVNINLGVQYRVADAHEYLFNVVDPKHTMASAAESALRTVVGNSTMDAVLSEGRAEIASQTKEQLQSILQNYHVGLEVLVVNLADVRPPEEVKDAFDDVTEAKEDRERYINEAQSYANTILPRARGEAASVMEQARAYRASEIARAQGDAARFTLLLDEYLQAPDVTRKRLYLETMQEVMGGVSTVLMDVEQGNNLIYLPLQEMLRNRGGANQTKNGSSVRNGITTVTPPEAYPREADRTRDGGRR